MMDPRRRVLTTLLGGSPARGGRGSEDSDASTSNKYKRNKQGGRNNAVRLLKNSMQDKQFKVHCTRSSEDSYST